MDNSNGLSAGDILALTKDNSMSGNNFWWIIVFLIVAGMFGGNGFFGNGNNATLASDEFIKRDIFNTNQNISNTASTTQRDILENKYALGTQALENRYTSQLGVQSIINNDNNNYSATSREIFNNRYENALGQSNLQKDLLLQGKDMQAQMAECCCTLRQEASANTQKVIDAITQNRIEELQYQLNQANTAVANAAQTRTILDTIGRYSVYAVPTYPSYYGYGVSGVV